MRAAPRGAARAHRRRHRLQSRCHHGKAKHRKNWRSLRNEFAQDQHVKTRRANAAVSRRGAERGDVPEGNPSERADIPLHT